MKKSPRLLRTLVFLLLLLPLLYSVVVLVPAALALKAIMAGVLLGPVVAGFVCFRFGRMLVRKGYASGGNTKAEGIEPSPNFLMRYLGVIIACGYTVLAALIAVCLPPWGNRGIFETAATVMFWSHLPSSSPVAIMQIFSAPSAWPFLISPFLIYLVFSIGMAWEFRRMGVPRTQWKGKAVFAVAFAVWAAVFFWRVDILQASVLRFSDDVARVDDTIYTEPYMPFRDGSKLVEIPAPALVIGSAHPRLDGATALFPVYAAAQAIYKNIAPTDVLKRVVVSTTPQAYTNLIEGRADVLFCAQPSPAQIAAAKAVGVELQLTPIGREAFVFFVNADNPVDALTSKQVRAIYKRRITNWVEVGGRKGKIMPFQRPANSGSQTAMELQVMRGEAMAMPLKEEQIRGMGGIILETAAYRNAPNAIGYSFRFFATTMTGAKGIKLLKIDGVAPTAETIRDRTYPYAGNFYAVTTNETANNPRVQELIAWFLSQQGQQLIEDVGYVSLGKN